MRHSPHHLHLLLTRAARAARAAAAHLTPEPDWADRAGLVRPAVARRRIAGRGAATALVGLSVSLSFGAVASGAEWPPSSAPTTIQALAAAIPALPAGGVAGDARVEATRRAEDADRGAAAATTQKPKPKAEPAPKPAAAAAKKPAEAPAPQPAVLPAVRGPLPVGKGMWLYLEERTEGGNAQAIVEKSKAHGLSHLYVRTGSSWKGFYAQDFLNRLLPAAHAANIRVYGWDFPNLRDARGDVDRALAAIHYTTPDGHRIDGFAPDIETRFEGTNILPETAHHYGTALRLAVGGGYPLIAVVPNPSPARVGDFPYDVVLQPFDAIAPMVYWLNRQPDTDVARALQYLARFGKPVFPIGQAYDGAPEGGRPGVPPRDELLRFFAAADEHGAAGVSFWSWQGADQQAWDTIRDAPQFGLRSRPDAFNRGQARGMQVLLSSLAFAAPASGIIDQPTTAAIAAYQQAAGLPPTGVIDDVTYRLLMTPFAPPISPIV